MRLLREGFIPPALGLILASGLSMMRMADHQPRHSCLRPRQPTQPLWAIAAGTAANIVALHFT